MSEVRGLARLMSEFKIILGNEVSNPNGCGELEDSTVNVLNYVARQLEKVNGEFTANLYDLTDEIKIILSETDGNGGAV